MYSSNQSVYVLLYAHIAQLKREERDRNAMNRDFTKNDEPWFGTKSEENPKRLPSTVHCMHTNAHSIVCAKRNQSFFGRAQVFALFILPLRATIPTNASISVLRSCQSVSASTSASGSVSDHLRANSVGKCWSLFVCAIGLLARALIFFFVTLLLLLVLNE